MKRRDLRVTLAIAVVLLAVFVVYLMVVPGTGEPTQTANSNAAPLSITKSDKATSAIDVTAPTSVAPIRTETSKPREISPVVVVPPVVEPTKPADVFATKPETPAETNIAVSEPKPSNDVDWARLLDGAPVLRSEAPTRTTGISSTPTNNATSSASGTSNGMTDGSSARSTEATSRTDMGAASGSSDARTGVSGMPTTQPGSSTHVVQRGETLSAIANKYYGKSSLWTLIAQSNPTIDPNKVRAGTSLVIPPLEQAAALMNSAPTASSSATPIDTKRQYEVKPGESFHKIASKLYGDAQKWEKLYEANKSKVGNDPAKLKAGTILELPEAPIASAQ